MATSSFTPMQHADFETGAFNDNHGRTAEVQPSSRILLALQDPEARRWMTRLLRAKGFRVIALDEPFAAWRTVAEHASPRLSGFDFVICGGFRTDRNSKSAHCGERFFLLLGRHGFVPLAADGTPPPAWAFRRASTGLIQGEPSSSLECAGTSAGVPCTETAPGHTQ
jgi:hypothetical protein